MSNPSTDRAAIGHIIDGLTNDGWTLQMVDDGGEEIPVSTKAEALTAITDVDSAHLFVVRGDDGDDTGWVWFVLGNEPFEVACDYTTNLTAIDTVTSRWEVR